MNDVAETDTTRLNLTFRIAVIGVGAVLLALLIALIFLHGAKNPGQVIPAVLGAVTAAIGTLVGLVAGHSAGAAGKAQSDQRATSNEQDAAAGRALAKSMLMDEPPPVDALAATGSTRARRLGAAPAGSETGDLARRHAELARSLFPDVEG